MYNMHIYIYYNLHICIYICINITHPRVDHGITHSSFKAKPYMIIYGIYSPELNLWVVWSGATPGFDITNRCD